MQGCNCSIRFDLYGFGSQQGRLQFTSSSSSHLIRLVFLCLRPPFFWWCWRIFNMGSVKSKHFFWRLLEQLLIEISCLLSDVSWFLNDVLVICEWFGQRVEKSNHIFKKGCAGFECFFYDCWVKLDHGSRSLKDSLKICWAFFERFLMMFEWCWTWAREV